MRGKWIVFLAFFMLLASAALALEAGETKNIEISIKPVNNSIFGNEIATYDVTIANSFDFDDHFRLSFSDDVEWVIQTDPLNYKLTGADIKEGRSITFRVTIQSNPVAIMPHRQYTILMTVRGESSQKWATGIFVVRYGPQFVGGKSYPAVLTADIEMPDKIDPRKGIEARIHLKNFNPLNITGLDIYFNSRLVNQHLIESIGPRESKTIVFTQTLNPQESPKKDTLIVNVAYNGEVLDTASKEFEIVSYSQFEETKEIKKNAFFKTTTLLGYRNNGNVEKTETVRYEVSFPQTLFTHSDLKSKLVSEDGKSYLTWDLKLGPNETKNIRVVVDYLPLLILIVLMIAVLIGYLAIKSPISIAKHAQLLSKKEGGIAGLKVVLRIKNHSKQAIHDLEVVDSVPSIVDIDKNFEMGHIAPTRIVDHGSRGILIKWKLGDMEPGEERIVSYKAVTRLTILGSFTLPAAVSRFIVNYKEKVTYSNRVRIQL